MNSQDSRKVKASSARTTRFMPARKAGKNGSTRARRRLVPAVAEAVEAGRRAAEIDHDEEERGERVEAEMRAEPGQAERQDQRPARRARDSRCAERREQAIRR